MTHVALLGLLGKLAGMVIFVGCFLVLGQQKQAILDMVAGTAVFKTTDLL